MSFVSGQVRPDRPLSAKGLYRQRSGLLYAAAFLGAHLAFIPLFTLLLPRRVEAIDPARSIHTLSLLLLAGGIAASLSHILAGRWSDRWILRHGNRRGIIVLGLALLTVSQLWLAFSNTFPDLLMAVIAFQFALNVMFAPLGALLADHVPDAHKGKVAGWLNASLPLASAGTLLAAVMFPRDGIGGFLVVISIVALTIIPLLAKWPFGKLAQAPGMQPAGNLVLPARSDFARVWTARLAVQIGAAFVIGYFYLFLGTLYPAQEAARRLAFLAFASMVASFLGAIVAGYWSDVRGRRRPPMIVAAICASLGLATLSLLPGWLFITVGYLLFHVGLTAFLSVDAALISQLVGASGRRGELLGYMNLTNTLPSVIVPLIGLSAGGDPGVVSWWVFFAAASALAIFAAILVAKVKTVA